MKKILENLGGNVHITLYDQNGNVKQDFTKKNTVTAHQIVALLGGVVYSAFVPNHGNYSALPWPTVIYFCSYDGTTVIDNNNIVAYGQECGIDAIWATRWYTQDTGRSVSTNNNPAEGYPYLSIQHIVPIGSGTGTIKSFIIGRTSAYFAGATMSAFLLLSPDQYVYKGSTDSLTIVWSFVVSGDFKTRKQF